MTWSTREFVNHDGNDVAFPSIVRSTLEIRVFRRKLFVIRIQTCILFHCVSIDTRIIFSNLCVVMIGLFDCYYNIWNTFHLSDDRCWLLLTVCDKSTKHKESNLQYFRGNPKSHQYTSITYGCICMYYCCTPKFMNVCKLNWIDFFFFSFTLSSRHFVISRLLMHRQCVCVCLSTVSTWASSTTTSSNSLFCISIYYCILFFFICLRVPTHKKRTAK